MTDSQAGDAAESETLILEPDPAAARLARSFADARCDAAALEIGSREIVVLLTSELVTNALLHGRSGVRLVVNASTNAARVEVSDDNSRRPAVAVRDDDALDGRGMAMVDALATRWGVRDEEIGKTVWFEVIS